MKKQYKLLLFPVFIVVMTFTFGMLGMTTNSRKLFENMKLEVTSQGESEEIEMSNSTLYYKMLELEEKYADMNARLSEERFEEIQADYENKIAESKKKAKLEAYPIGSIYTSLENKNPSTFLGGTWERIAQGRTLIGVDEDDPDFNTVKKEIGHKELQAHSHTIKAHTHTVSGTTNNTGNHAHGIYMYTKAANASTRNSLGTSSINSGTRNTTTTGAHTHTVSGTAASGGAGTTSSYGEGNAGNIQPSLTVYFFQRTA